MIVELHILTPSDLKEVDSLYNNAIAVQDGKLVLSVASFSNPGRRPEKKQFEDYWLPPEMRPEAVAKPFVAILSFSDVGELLAIDYVVLHAVHGGDGPKVVRMAGEAEVWTPYGPEQQKVATRFTSIPRPGVCVLTFPVILRDGEKFFAFPDGWVTNAIPALREFEERYYDDLSGPAKNGSMLYNLLVYRKSRLGLKKVVGHGYVGSTGGMGEYSIIQVENFSEGSYPTRLFASRFEVDDEVELTFNYYGTFPVVRSFLDVAIVEGIVPSMEIGRAYAPGEFFQIVGADTSASAERLLPDMEATKTIILHRS